MFAIFEGGGGRNRILKHAVYIVYIYFYARLGIKHQSINQYTSMKY